ncbi:succinylglutamate desuccinylase/aspartoacylase family protein (plasmid) [Cytobacillus oceanisediminis]|uniref:succinylglutamate desuccinylase/aspartoacylase family protein n=1 Tax=Cytobacillus oceanisediminis TaxID=665099 RepID=UPI001863BEEF|nr:succinylglutamate desuccinylase/aspartoacylase family protein [Cytobacillus oceanisediminis]QOK29901.1 succinylglutamate desuccinylase/aspartoacylase family protein [Cytobacillus oceanisediminis]
MKSIGTAQVKPGEKTKGYLQVGSDTDGSPIQIPVLVAAGKKDGPTIWVQAGIHGDEFGGTASIIRFFQELEVEELRGTFVGIPVVNLPSYKARYRTSPIDGDNLNRIFPGNPKGTYSQRLAHTLLQTITENADYMLDLHSGGIGLHVPYFLICRYAETESSEKSLWLAERMGSEVIWRVEGESSTAGVGTDYVMKNGIPAVTIEVGGGNVTEEHEHLYKEAIGNAMKALEMIDGNVPVLDKYTMYKQGDFIFAGYGGMFVPACEVGSILNKGDLIGAIINLHGEVLEELRCSVDNAYLAATGHRYWPAHPGQLIAETYFG